MIQTNTLCAHLWNHLVVDFRKLEFRLCCKTSPISASEKDLILNGENLFLNSEMILSARKEMLAGGRPALCQSCWALEDKGLPSHRTSFIEWKKSVKDLNYTDLNLDTASPRELTQSNYPDNLDIQIGNTCDLKCIYCNDQFSSAWSAENKKHGILWYENNLSPTPASSEHQNLFLTHFWNLFKKTKFSYKRIAFLGGEPLISNNFYEILNLLLSEYETPPNNLEINIITNLNTPKVFFDQFLKILPELSQKFTININISMEAWGQQAEYIRSGLNFDRFINNFEGLLALNLKLKFTTITTLNILCLSTLEKYLRWVRNSEVKYKKTIEVHYNLVSYPSFLSIDLATPSMARFVSSAASFIETDVLAGELKHSHWFRYHAQLLQIKKTINERPHNAVQSKKLHSELLKFTNEIDKRRGLGFKNIFTEVEYQELVEL